MVPWKVFWTALGGLATLAGGIVPVKMGVHPYVVAAFAPLAVALAIIFARLAVKYATMFVGATDSTRLSIAALITLAIMVHGAWVVTLQLVPVGLPWWIAAVVVLSGTEYGIARGYEYLQVVKQRYREASPHESAAARPLDEVEQTFAAALHRAALGPLQVTGRKELRDDE